tara:strand:+ start:94 stop:474 length:381 start_codon:yes stop_codon:yes gene_type:complete
MIVRAKTEVLVVVVAVIKNPIMMVALVILPLSAHLKVTMVVARITRTMVEMAAVAVVTLRQGRRLQAHMLTLVMGAMALMFSVLAHCQAVVVAVERPLLVINIVAEPMERAAAALMVQAVAVMATA